MRQFKYLSVLTFLLLFFGLVPATAQNQETIRSAEQLIQKTQYDQALKVLAGYKGSEERDTALWLTALASFKLGKVADAEGAALSFKTQFPQSGWFHKVNFLLSEIHLKQKNYKAAEKIYAEEAERLLSEGRKKENAEIYIKLAQSLGYKPKADELDLPKPDYNGAYRYYKEALALEIGPELSQTVRFSMAKTMEISGNLNQAIVDYRSYLALHDPEWPRDSNTQVDVKDIVKGTQIREARLGLAEVLLRSGRNLEARSVLEDLISMKPEDPRFVRLAMRRLPFTFRVPSPSSDYDLDAGVRGIDKFLAKFPGDSIAVTLAWYKAQSYVYRGRTDDAIGALRDLFDKKSLTVSGIEAPEEKVLREEIGVNLSPEEQFARYQKEALSQIGSLYMGQQKYPQAIKAFSDYISNFPNGPAWTDAQKGIVDAEYQMGVDKVLTKDYAGAEKIWGDFLNNHPLDSRAKRILFTLAQVQYQSGLDLKTTDRNKAIIAFNTAIIGFKKLVSKYPNTEESSLAQLNIAEIQERELGDFEAAIKSYGQLTWGSKAYEAQSRVSRMTNKELVLRTERIFRTNETAAVKVQVRNIEKLKINAYKINMESYFRKFHSLDGIEKLDLALIQPDKTWEVTLKGYAKYLPLEQEIPLPGTGPGVYAVTVSSTELESTTLVIQSDLDALVKTSRKEVLVFVQDMVKNLGVNGARVLITDGKKILLETKTGIDGALLQAIADLSTASDLRAFVEFNGHVAATGLELEGLSVSSGLTPKGYIYTDKPAYKPGERVQIKGIIRDVVNGSYAIPQSAKFTVAVTDPSGKSIFREERSLGEFGTLGLDLLLSTGAAQGKYSIGITSKTLQKYFNGSFRVQDYKLEKVKLSLDFGRPVYFRGEKVQAIFKAMYYFGQSVNNHDIRYTTPDGLVHDAKTDDQGTLKVEFDSGPYLPGQILNFSATLSGENVSVYKSVPLALQEFTVQISSPRSVILAGTPQEFTIRTQDILGTKISKEVEVNLLRRVTRAQDPITIAVPWLKENQRDLTYYSEVSVEKRTVKTDASGVARITFSPKDGGTYLLRARAVDRFDNTITSDYALSVSDDTDETKLRLFAEKTTYTVGSNDTITLHSRFKSPTLALVSFEGDGIIKYSIITLNKAENKIPFTIGNEHFPNFTIHVGAMSAGQWHQASQEFEVERQLNVAIKPLKSASSPGEVTPVEVLVTDHQGKPVSAEFSLGLVNEALLSLYADPATPIVAYFQDGSRRLSPMRTAASIGFSYSPATTAVNQDIVNEEGRVNRPVSAQGPQKERSKKSDRDDAEDELGFADSPSALAGEVSMDRMMATTSIAQKPEVQAPGAAPRPETGSGGYWVASVVTDKTGKATLSIPMPLQTSSFQYKARAVTRDSLVGEAVTSVSIRKDFFATLKTPTIFQENDEVRLLGQVHNLSPYQGPVTAQLTLVIDGKSLVQPIQNLILGPGETKELAFPGFKIPSAQKINVQLSVKGTEAFSDAVAIEVPVRPWGIPLGVRKNGTAQDSVTVFTELPPNKKYESQWMSISLSPPTNRALIQSILENYTGSPSSVFCTPFLSGPETRLHSLAALYEYTASKDLVPGIEPKIRTQILESISDLVSTQRSDGSWSLTGSEESVNITAQAYWSLVQATKNGFEVDEKALANAKTFLKNRFTALPQDEDELKSIIQYALSFSGDADYSFINRLYRIRAELSEASLVFTALTLARLDKKEMGIEVLTVLGTKVLEGKYWSGSTNHPWLRNPVEATAMALIAYQTLKPADPLVASAVAYLQSVENPQGYSPTKAMGYVAQALTSYYGATKKSADDYSVQVLVNDQNAGSVRVLPGSEYRPDDQTFQIPASLLKEGKNKVQFTYSGKGEYRYFIDFSGFSKEITDPKSWKTPNFEAKKYIHEPLRYKGAAISKSTMQISSLEMAQTAEVEVVLNSGYRQEYMVLEDYIPAGAVLLKDTIQGSFTSVVFENAKVLFYFKPGEYISNIRYTLASYTPGKFQVLPPVLRAVFSPAEYRVGTVGSLEILGPSEKTTQAYVMNKSELFALGSAHFKDGSYKTALELLETLYGRDQKSEQPNLARMLLWIRTEAEFYDAQKVVSYFEILKEKYPELSIPFSKIMRVGKAYHDIGEFERAYLIYRAVVDSSFLKDTAVAGNLERSGEVLGSIDFMTNLWKEYNDSPTVINAWFSLAQAVYSLAPQAETLSTRLTRNTTGKAPVKFTVPQLLDKSAGMFWQFASVYPDNELVDDAAFTMLNISLDKRNYKQVLDQSKNYQKDYPKSSFFSNYQYMEALAQFSLRQYQEAILAAKKVAEGKSENKDLSTYILGQIFHSQKKPDEALGYYKAIQDQFPDAAEAIRYFENKTISMEEINLHAPGDKITLPIKYRNIKELNLQVYKVDLMKLYLREKNLSKITKINLSGIAPSIEKSIVLGNGKDYMDKTTSIPLALTDEGAYLVVCRGDDLFTSGLVLISPLKIEVQEEEGSQRVRVNVYDTVKMIYPDGVHVKVVGSNTSQLISGETDLRGIFIADGVTGITTVIARDQANRYAFYRGSNWVGPQNNIYATPASDASKLMDFDKQYRGNDYRTQEALKDSNRENLNKLYQEKVDGVQVQQAK